MGTDSLESAATSPRKWTKDPTKLVQQFESFWPRILTAPSPHRLPTWVGDNTYADLVLHGLESSL